MDEIVLKEEHAECISAAVGWWEETITNYEKLKNPLDWFKNLSFRKIKGKELKKFHEALTQTISADLERHEFVQLYVRNGLPCFMLYNALRDAGINNRTAELGEIEMYICYRDVVVNSEGTKFFKTVWSRDCY